MFTTAAQFWDAGLNDTRITTVSSHNVRTFPAEIHGRPMHYFTLLRRPREHMLSALRYLLQERNAYGVPADVPSTVPAIATWLMTQSYGTIYRENTQTNHIALYPWSASTGGRCDPHSYGRWAVRDQRAYERERLGLAKEILSGFLVAGAVEHLVATMTLVRSRAAALGIMLPPVETIEHDNVTSISRSEAFAALENDPLREQLRDSVAVDRELHAFATELVTR